MAKTKLYTFYMGFCGGTCSKWRLRRLHAYRLQTYGPPHIFTNGDYYSSQVSTITHETDDTIERCGCDFQAAQLVSPLLYQPWLILETMLHAEMQNQMLFVAQRATAIVMLSSNSLARENISVSPRPGRGLRFTHNYFVIILATG